MGIYYTLWAITMFTAFTLLSMCVSVAVSAAVLADHHQPCKPPSMTGELGVSNSHKQGYTVGVFVYDSEAKKLRFTTKKESSFNSSLVEDVLMLFEEGVFYDIDYKTKTCQKKAMGQPVLNPMELPYNATFLNKWQLGRASVQDEGLLFDVWKVAAPGLKAPYVSSLSNGCLPLDIMYSSDPATLLINIFDVELGIKYPNALTLPSICEGAPLEVMPEGMANDFFKLFL